jgi:hypothetical protein
MLMTLEIENFKGISSRQRIDLAPLTLLFGGNSAGKSTILQALLYLHEVVERGSADVDRTELGGDVLELGGFARMVHRHDLERTIVLRAEFETLGSLERFGRDLDGFPFPDLEDDIDSAWIELTMVFRTAATFRGAVVDRATIGVNGDREPLVWLELGPSLREGKLLYARINLGHALLATEAREHHDAIVTEIDGTSRPITTPHAPAEVTEAWEQIAVPEEVLHRALESDGYGGGTGAGAGLGDGSGFGDGRSLPLFTLARTRMSALPHPDESIRVIPNGHDSPENAAAAEQVRTFLEMVVLGTTAQLVSFLRDATYIGPLRAIPRRGFLYERAGRVANWADGLAAWDLLLSDRQDRVRQANHWLRRLGAGCQILVQQLFDRGADAEDLSQGHVDKTVRRLLLDTDVTTLVLPSEVGAGISQVVPVIVGALEDHAGLTMIEQPELHIHPVLQTNLGDLFIVASARRQFLIETHSEHLILRALRRIRETNAGELNDGDPPFTPDKLSVIYVEATADGTTFKQLRVDEAGEFVDRWPHGFFEERALELF